MSHSVRNCQAKAPSTCPYHGATSDAAVKRNDINGFIEAKTKENQTVDMSAFFKPPVKPRTEYVIPKSDIQRITEEYETNINKIDSMVETLDTLEVFDIETVEYRNSIIKNLDTFRSYQTSNHKTEANLQHMYIQSEETITWLKNFGKTYNINL